MMSPSSSLAHLSMVSYTPSLNRGEDCIMQVTLRMVTLLVLKMVAIGIRTVLVIDTTINLVDLGLIAYSCKPQVLQ